MPSNPATEPERVVNRGVGITGRDRIADPVELEARRLGLRLSGNERLVVDRAFVGGLRFQIEIEERL